MRPARDLEVSLITYGPGAIYWERFGHDAIRIRDRVSGESADFNYGVFDFEDRAFLWNFARGYMRYMIAILPSDDGPTGLHRSGPIGPRAATRPDRRASGEAPRLPSLEPAAGKRRLQLRLPDRQLRNSRARCVELGPWRRTASGLSQPARAIDLSPADRPPHERAAVADGWNGSRPRSLRGPSLERMGRKLSPDGARARDSQRNHS